MRWVYCLFCKNQNVACSLSLQLQQNGRFSLFISSRLFEMKTDEKQMCLNENRARSQPRTYLSIFTFKMAQQQTKNAVFCNIANRSWQFFGFNFHESISRRLFAAFDHFFFVFKEWRIIYMPNKVKFQRFNRQSCTKQLHRIFIALAVKPISQMNSISIKYPKAF